MLSTLLKILLNVGEKGRGEFKAAREKQRINCEGTPIRLLADFSTEMMWARRE